MLLIFLRKMFKVEGVQLAKLHNRVCVCVLSPQVKSVHCKAGETVGEGDLLVELE